MASPEIVVLAEAPRKKARKQNFTPTEIATLSEKVEENLAILQSKLKNSITNQKKMSSEVKLLRRSKSQSQREVEKPPLFRKEIICRFYQGTQEDWWWPSAESPIGSNGKNY